MSLPPLTDQLFHIAQWFITIVTGGFLICAIVAIAQALEFGPVERPADGTLPGIIEQNRPVFLGPIPEFVGSVGGITGGLILYFALSAIVVIGSAISILSTGTGLPVEKFLYFNVSFSVIYTLVLQNEIRQRVASSKWYLGYETF